MSILQILKMMILLEISMSAYTRNFVNEKRATWMSRKCKE